MVKKIKLQARETLFANYKSFIIPSVIFIISTFAVNIIINYFTRELIWSDLGEFLCGSIILLFLLFEFVIIPVSVVLIFKVAVNTENSTDAKNGIKELLGFSNIRKIILINFIPRLMSSFFAINRSHISALKIIDVKGTLLIVISVISFFVSYKFFACNYCFALNQTSVKQTIKSSFKIMKIKNVLPKFILLELSFILWVLLVTAIYAVLKVILSSGNFFMPGISLDKVYTPFLDAFFSIGFGINLYLIPYLYLTISLFLKEQIILNKKCKKF